MVMVEIVRVAVTGGRNNFNYDSLWGELDLLHDARTIDVIIEGGAKGIDAGARQWAEYARVKCVTVPALWNEHGPAAGPIRNQRIIDAFKPDLLIACRGGKGTADMVKRAVRAGIEIIKIA
jgi:YspA, cpYpsA-related SLOG family